MNLDFIPAAVRSNFTVSSLILRSAYIICLAIAIELAVFWFNKFVERQISPLLNADTGRETAWKMRRRQLLRQTPKIFGRSIVYVVAVLLFFSMLGLPVLELALAVGAVVAIFAGGMVPILRDMTQGYAHLAEDTLAIGDSVQIGNHQGTVERFTLRSTAIRDREGRLHVLSNREIQDVIVLQRREGKGKE